jgi:hypothetical protein
MPRQVCPVGDAFEIEGGTKMESAASTDDAPVAIRRRAAKRNGTVVSDACLAVTPSAGVVKRRRALTSDGGRR